MSDIDFLGSGLKKPDEATDINFARTRQNWSYDDALTAIDPTWRVKVDRNTTSIHDLLKKMPGDPTQNYERINKSLFLSQIYNRPVNDVMNSLDMYEQQYWGDANPLSRGWQAYADVMDTAYSSVEIASQYGKLAELREALARADKATPMGMVNYQRGQTYVPSAEASALRQGEQRKSDAQKEIESLIQAKEKEIAFMERRLQTIPQESAEKGFLMDVWKGAAPGVASIAHILKESAPEILIGAGLGFATGGASLAASLARSGLGAIGKMALANGARSLLRSTLTGLQAGGMVGSPPAAYDLESGAVYQQLMAAGVPHQYAYGPAQTAGVINAAFEIIGGAALTKIVSTPFQAAARELTKGALRSGLKRGLITAWGVRYAAGVAESVGVETLTESFQQLTSELAYNHAVDTANQAEKLGIPQKTWEEIWQSVGEAASMAAVSSLLIGGATSGISATTSVFKDKPLLQKAVAYQNADPALANQAILDTLSGENDRRTQRIQNEGTKVSDQEGKPLEVYHAGTDPSGMVAFHSDPSTAAAQADAIHYSVDPGEFVQGVRSTHGDVAGNFAVELTMDPDAPVPASLKLDESIIAKLREGARYTQKDLGKSVVPETVIDSYRELGIELQAPNIYPAMIDAQNVLEVTSEAELRGMDLSGYDAVVIRNQDGSMKVLTTPDRAAMLDPVPVSGWRIPKVDGRMVTRDSGTEFSALDPFTKGELATIKYENQGGRATIKELPENPRIARELIKAFSDVNPNWKLDVDYGTRRKLVQTEPEFRRLSGELNEAYSRMADLESAMHADPADNLAKADKYGPELQSISAQIDAITERMDEVESEILGIPENHPTEPVPQQLTVREKLHRDIERYAPKLSTAEREGAIVVMEVRAHAMGLTLEQWTDRYLAGFADFETAFPGQGERGAVKFLNEGKGLIYLGRNSDASTIVHEIGHIIRRQLPMQDQMALLGAYGSTTWDTATEEKFTADWEAYFYRGEFQNSQLQTIFEKIVKIFRAVYEWLRDGFGEIQAPVRQVIESALSERDVYATPTVPEYHPVSAMTKPSGRYDVRELLVDEIFLSPDVPQFKENADETGAVEKLQAGGYERLGTAPIVVWERLSGRHEVITGRHRLELARRLGEKTIPSQIVRESEGFTAQDAMRFDAEANIRDNQGTVKDFARYFRGQGVTKEDAQAKGLLSREKGREGYAIGTWATDNTFALYMDGKISGAKAAAISEAAPGNEQVQGVAVKSAKDMSPDELFNYARLVSQMSSENAQQLDMFGNDDSALIEAAKIAAEGAKVVRELETELSTLKSAKKLSGPKAKEILAKFGLQAGDVAAMESRIADLEGQVTAWRGWATDSAKHRELRIRLGLPVREEVQVQEEVTQDTETPLLFQKAYHGTAHRFDRFTSDKIGSGTGAQTYGYGLYFTGDKEIAEYYRGTLKDKAWIQQEGPNFYVVRDPDGNVISSPDKNGILLRDEAQKIKEAWDKNQGQVYEVAIPDNAEFLDYEKPIRDQSEHVRNALKEAENNPEAQRIFATYFDESETGVEIYRGIALAYREADDINKVESEKRASLFLKGLGIAGIKFPDTFSSEKSDGYDFYNYVVFHDSDIEITQTFYQSAGESITIEEVRARQAKFEELNSQLQLDFEARQPTNDAARQDYWYFKATDTKPTKSIIGKKITGWEPGRNGLALTDDVARQFYEILKDYRNRAYETFRFVFVDEAGQVVDHVAVTSQHPSRALIGMGATPDERELWLHGIKKQAEERNLKIVIAHNHPSGKVEPSQQDYDVTNRLLNFLGEEMLVGHVILDHGKMAAIRGDLWIPKKNDFITIDVSEDPTLNTAETPSWALKPVKGGELGALARAEKFASYLHDDGAHIPVFLASSSAQLTAMRYIPREVWEKPESFTQYIKDAHVATGTIWAFPVVDIGDSSLANMYHSKMRLVMDYVVVDRGEANASDSAGGSATDQIKLEAKQLFQSAKTDERRLIDSEIARIQEQAEYMARTFYDVEDSLIPADERIRAKAEEMVRVQNQVRNLEHLKQYKPLYRVPGKTALIRPSQERYGAIDLLWIASGDVLHFGNRLEALMYLGNQASPAGVDNSFELEAERVKRETEQLSLFQPITPSLIAMHNIDSEKILAVKEFGGMPLPSIAVTKPDIPFTGFGDVTLIASRDKALKWLGWGDVYSRDIWSPTVPRPTWKIKSKVIDDFDMKLSKLVPERKMRVLSDQAGTDDKASPGFIQWIGRRTGTKLAFLRDTGNTVESTMKAAPDLGSRLGWLADKEKARAYVEAYESNNSETMEDMSRFYAKTTGVEYADGLYKYAKLAYNRALEVLNYTPEIDVNSLQDKVNALMVGKEAEYQSWLQENLGSAWTEPTIKVGKEKLPFNAQSVYKWMMSQSKVGSQESLTFGPSKAASNAARAFTDREDMRAMEDRLLDGKLVDEAIKTLDPLHDKFQELADKYKYGDRWGALDELYRAQARYLKGGITKQSPSRMRTELGRAGFVNLNDSDIETALTLAHAVASLPTDYFEAKPSDILHFTDFVAAVVPEQINPAALAVLQEIGVKVETYTNEADRTAKVKQVAYANDTLFQPEQADIKQQALDGEPVPYETLWEQSAEQWAADEVQAFQTEDYLGDLSDGDTDSGWINDILFQDEEPEATDVPRDRDQANAEFLASDFTGRLKALREKVDTLRGTRDEEWYRLRGIYWGPKTWAYLIAKNPDAKLAGALSEIKANPDTSRVSFAALDLDGELLRAYAKMDDAPSQDREMRSQDRIAAIKAILENGLKDTESQQIDDLHKAAQTELDTAYLDATEADQKIAGYDKELSALIDDSTEAAKAAKEKLSKVRAEWKERRDSALKRQKQAHKKKIEYRRMLEYKWTLIEKIQKAPSSGVDFEYAEEIRAIQANLDPNLKGSKSKWKIKRSLVFLDNRLDFDEQIAKTIEDRIASTGLGKYTVGELEKIARHVEALRKVGIAVRKAKLESEKAWVSQTAQALANETLDGRTVIEREPIVKAKKENIKKLWLETMSGQNILDDLDNRKDYQGLWHKTFYMEASRLENEKAQILQPMMKGLQDKMKELGISKADLYGEFMKFDATKQHKGKVKEIVERLSLQDAIGVWVYWQNEKAQQALIHGNRLPQNVLNAVLTSLPANAQALGQWMIDQFHEQIYPKVREAYIDDKNVDLAHEENYFPMLRKDSAGAPLDAEMLDDIQRRSAFGGAKPKDGFTKSRINIPKQFQTPIRLDAFSIFMTQAEKQVHYALYKPWLKRMSRVVNDKYLESAVIQMKGAPYVTALKGWLAQVANPDLFAVTSNGERALRALRSNFSVNALVMNIPAILSNATAPLLYIGEAGPLQFGASLAKAPVMFGQMYKRMIELAPQMKDRATQLSIETMKRDNPTAFARFRTKVGEFGFLPYRLLDTMTITIGWDAVFNKFKAQGMSDQDAAAQATAATLRTQPAATGKDLSALMANKGAISLLTQFATALSAMWNMTAHLPTWKRKKTIVKWLLGMFGIGIGGFLLFALKQRRPPEDEEEVAEWIALGTAKQFMDNIPVLGSTISGAILEGRDPWALQAYSAAANIAQSVRNLGTLVYESRANGNLNALKRDKLAMDTLYSLIDGGGAALGLPGLATKRIVKAAEDEQTLDSWLQWLVLGGKPKDM